MYFITIANHQNVVEEQEIEKTQLKAIFEKLKSFINQKSNIFLNKLSFEDLISEHEKFEVMVYKKTTKYQGNNTIISNSYPAYHTKIECERLNSYYSNFIFPDEIDGLDENKKNEFINWFTTNKNSIIANKQEFKKELFDLWNMSNIPKQFIIENSGVYVIRYLKNEDIVNELKFIFVRLNKYLLNNRSENKIILDNLNWIYTINNNELNIMNLPKSLNKDILINFNNEFIIPIISLLLEYLKINLNVKIDPHKDIIEQLGLSGCYGCTVDNRSKDVMNLLFNN